VSSYKHYPKRQECISIKNNHLTYEAMKFFKRLNSFVEVDTKRLFQNEAADFSRVATGLLLLA